MKVLIGRKIPRAGINMLRQYPELELDYRQGSPLSPEELTKAASDADAIIAVIPDKITKELIEGAKNLKIIAAYSVGFDNIDLEAATKKGIYVSNTPGELTDSVAEFAMALMLAVGRQITRADRFVTDGKYDYWDPMIFLGPKFAGKTLGIVGMGRIGYHFAKMCKAAFGMEILYSDVQGNIQADTELEARHVPLEELLGNSDIVSIHVPLLPSTRHMITNHEFKLMKPTAFLINTSRGPVIDEDDLIIALQEDWIAGAGIDVYEEEPKIRKELKELDNVVLTPHIGSATREARIEMARMAAANVIEVLINKKPPIHLVNKGIK